MQAISGFPAYCEDLLQYCEEFFLVLNHSESERERAGRQAGSDQEQLQLGNLIHAIPFSKDCCLGSFRRDLSSPRKTAD